MPVTYNNNLKDSLDVEKITDAINSAEFSSETVTAKGAPVAKQKSRFADPDPVDPKHQIVKSKLSIDVGSLPPNESKFLLDIFDRFTSQENGKLVLTENCQAIGFDPEKVCERITAYAHQKVDKVLGDKNLVSDFRLPTQQEIGTNEKSSFFSWLKKSIAPSQGLER